MERAVRKRLWFFFLVMSGPGASLHPLGPCEKKNPKGRTGGRECAQDAIGFSTSTTLRLRRFGAAVVGFLTRLRNIPSVGTQKVFRGFFSAAKQF